MDIYSRLFEIMFYVQSLSDFIHDNPEFSDMEKDEKNIKDLKIVKWRSKIYR